MTSNENTLATETELPITKDSGWSSYQVGRCITDFYRTIEFARPITPEELQLVRVWLETNKCPGWTGVFPKSKDTEGRLWQFETTWDSSD